MDLGDRATIADWLRMDFLDDGRNLKTSEVIRRCKWRVRCPIFDSREGRDSLGAKVIVWGGGVGAAG